ncbi:hypothetical protein [Sphingomonas sp. NIC1]|uniref:hypothetical protein n=1 Tax=Sphingomonas sp. NIC1 TaxID=1961362 RepID=UPI0007C0FA2C|nr:hypothetical protein [Sphingomonas sp. NIC1]ANC85485.1 hypothetical protein A7E77_00360 [Sphingomonas sp. NIC1]
MNEEGPRTPPIEPQSYLGGVTVIDFGDLRVARGMTRRPVRTCRHHGLRYDDRERRIWCSDCETDVEPFDAFKLLVEHFDGAQKKARRMLEEANEAQSFQLRSIAAKEIDQKWRKRNMVPACPHCRAGIWPEDVKRMGLVGKEYDSARRARAADPARKGE